MFPSLESISDILWMTEPADKAQRWLFACALIIISSGSHGGGGGGGGCLVHLLNSNIECIEEEITQEIVHHNSIHH